MTARMTVGTAMLFIYVIASDRLGPVTELNAAQWTFVIVTGCFLLLFTATTFTAIRHAYVSTVLAIGTAAPIITTLLQVIATGRVGLGLADVGGLVVTLIAVPAIVVVGLRQEERSRQGLSMAG